MDIRKICEDTIDLWDKVSVAYTKKYEKPPSFPVHAILFERVHTFIIHKNIQKEHTNNSNNEPSEKQMKLIRDLGDPNWTGTKKEAHEHIEQLIAKKNAKKEG